MDTSATARAPVGFDPADVAPPSWVERERPVVSLALDVSGRCNLACRYCAEAATQPQHRPLLSFPVLDQALELLLPDGVPQPASSIRLGSGEPLLALPMLKQLARRLEQVRCKGHTPPQVFLTTNGTLADRSTRDWLVETGWHIKISLDGPPEVHDRWRVTSRGAGTYRRVAVAVIDLAHRIPNRLSVTAVLCRGNDPAEVFNGIASLGVRRIELVPAVHKDPAVAPGPEDAALYGEFVASWVERYLVSPSTNAAPQLVRLINAARRVMGYDVERVVCGAGRNFFGVASDGSLYPCFRFVGVEKYRLGTLGKGVDPSAARRFRENGGRPYDQRRPCRRCWAAPLCGGPCFACAEFFGLGSGEPCPVHCEYIRADARAAVELVQRLRDINPGLLLKFLPPISEAEVVA